MRAVLQLRGYETIGAMTGPKDVRHPGRDLEAGNGLL